jgi:hypothetical protein
VAKELASGSYFVYQKLAMTSALLDEARSHLPCFIPPARPLKPDSSFQ